MSLGGMQALQWAVDYPDAVNHVVALTPMAKTAPWAGAINHAARQSLFAKLGVHPRPGDYPAGVWDGWTPIMQMLAMRTPQPSTQPGALRRLNESTLEAIADLPAGADPGALLYF